jgi:hypothetical protein
MEALCATITAPLVALLRASGGCPVGEAMNAPLLQPQLAARAAALQARAGALLARVGEALEAGSGAALSAALMPGASARAAAAADLRGPLEFLDRLLEATETALDEASGRAAKQQGAGAGGALGAAGAGAGAGAAAASSAAAAAGSGKGRGGMQRGRAGVGKPQAHFPDAIDNSRATVFQPRIPAQYAALAGAGSAAAAAGALEADSQEAEAAAAKAQMAAMRVTPPPSAVPHPLTRRVLALAYQEHQVLPVPAPAPLRPLEQATLVDTPQALEAMLAYLEGSPEAMEEEEGEGGGGGGGGGDVRLPMGATGRCPLREFALDLEHHSLRSFQGFTCLLQLS